MARDIDLFVDEMLDDVVRRWTHEQDFDPAWRTPQCTQPWIRSGHMPDCARFAAGVRHRKPPGRLALLRGQCREQQFIRDLCLGRIERDVQGRLRRVPRSRWGAAATAAAAANTDVRRGVRVTPTMRRSPIADAVFGPLGERGTGRNPGLQPALEHKSMWVARYVDPRTGRIDRQALRDRVLREANQVRRQQQWAGRPPAGRHEVRPGMPLEHELVYSLSGLAGLPAHAVRGVRSLIQHTASRAGVRSHILDMDG
ncbi:hypothetical protein LRS03_24575 [Rhizobacter sp. J219]|jgi:hypothetical protein|uniref:hypothetical protein n=1 Tax=Rhizobacter sp. J219 TaxID=2898430 RepID=UPI0021513765|nr:hypothetical protein [Rhizobacter sp. J219]MCR5885860.1 hypothetical protein [Rhizobacter sp. J219]